MARKTTLARTQEMNNHTFRFIWIQWTDGQLDALRSYISNHPESDSMHLQELSDASWKVSLSINQRTGKYLVALTDKGGRSGCKGKTFAVEHKDLTSALAAAFYFAIEILGDQGYTDDEVSGVDLF